MHSALLPIEEHAIDMVDVDIIGSESMTLTSTFTVHYRYCYRWVFVWAVYNRWTGTVDWTSGLD